MNKKTFPQVSKLSADYIELVKELSPQIKDYQTSWNYNVLPPLKGKSQDEIKQYVKEKQFNYSVLFENVMYDINMASGVRNANAFGAKNVYYVGYKRFDRRGACGVYHYTPIQYIKELEQFEDILNSHDHIIGLDYVEGKSVSMINFDWKPNTLLIFGSEGYGISPILQSVCDQIVHIDQFGSVPSLNVATASGIIMNSYISHIRK